MARVIYERDKDGDGDEPEELPPVVDPAAVLFTQLCFWCNSTRMMPNGGCMLCLDCHTNSGCSG